MADMEKVYDNLIIINLYSKYECPRAFFLLLIQLKQKVSKVQVFSLLSAEPEEGLEIWIGGGGRQVIMWWA